MKKFSSPGGAQRFRSAFSGISPHLRPGRHRLTAEQYRHEMTARSTHLKRGRRPTRGRLTQTAASSTPWVRTARPPSMLNNLTMPLAVSLSGIRLEIGLYVADVAQHGLAGQIEPV